MPSTGIRIPFNSGYFMCVKLKGIDAETFRKHLLEKSGVGVIADGERDIRVAFSAVEASEFGGLFRRRWAWRRRSYGRRAAGRET